MSKYVLIERVCSIAVFRNRAILLNLNGGEGEVKLLYINSGLSLFVISLSLFLIAMNVENIIFIISGLIINFVGAIMLVIGGIKKAKGAH